jgi:hypothetical protein
MNDDERRLWVLNDEGLYNEWQSSHMSLKNFIAENREELTKYINAVLNKNQKAKTWRDYASGNS